MEISVISLRGASDRRRQVKAQLKDIGIPWSFFDALTSIDPEMILDEDQWLATNGRLLNSGELGCYASHFRLLSNLAKKSDDTVMLILEDDVILDPNFFRNLEDLTELVNNYGYIRLNGQKFCRGTIMEVLGRHRIVRFHEGLMGTLAYLINSQTARQLLPHIQYVRRAFDIEIDRFWANGVPIYCVHPYVAIERMTHSQLGERDVTVLSPMTYILWKTNNQWEKILRLKANIVMALQEIKYKITSA